MRSSNARRIELGGRSAREQGVQHRIGVLPFHHRQHAAHAPTIGGQQIGSSAVFILVNLQQASVFQHGRERCQLGDRGLPRRCQCPLPVSVPGARPRSRHPSPVPLGAQPTVIPQGRGASHTAGVPGEPARMGLPQHARKAVSCDRIRSLPMRPRRTLAGRRQANVHCLVHPVMTVPHLEERSAAPKPVNPRRPGTRRTSIEVPGKPDSPS